MAVFLLRALHGRDYAPPAAAGLFADVPRSHPFAAWIERLFAASPAGARPRPSASVRTGR